MKKAEYNPSPYPKLFLDEAPVEAAVIFSKALEPGLPKLVCRVPDKTAFLPETNIDISQPAAEAKAELEWKNPVKIALCKIMAPRVTRTARPLARFLTLKS